MFEAEHADDERRALIEAASRWKTASPRLPSLADGIAEFERIDQ